MFGSRRDVFGTVRKSSDCVGNSDRFMAKNGPYFGVNCMFLFSPNTSSSSSSPTDRCGWAQKADSDEQDKQSYTKRMKRTRSCLSKSKRRRSPGTPRAVLKDLHEFMNVHSSRTKCCYYQDEPTKDGLSWPHTEKVPSCSCSDSDQEVLQGRCPVVECPNTTGSPVSFQGRKAKRKKQWNSNSDSSDQIKRMSMPEMSSGEISDLEPQFIPDLTNDSMEFTDEEQFKNVILRFSESSLEEEVNSTVAFI